jgi:adenine-specific DNA-methyltransferase
MNIPTEELRDFMKEDETKTILYPRDPSLDPQLVWKARLQSRSLITTVTKR